MTRILSFLLALMLAFTSQSMAVARGASAATGQMVLCTGSGPVAVYTDAQGQPTSAPHICPDAALNVLVDTIPQDVYAPWQIVPASVLHVRGKVAPPILPRMAPQSRAPPLMV